MRIARYLAPKLEHEFKHPYVHIVFGARQTGKTTLLRELLEPDLDYNLADPEERGRLLAQPGLFRRECEAALVPRRRTTVFVDEAQLVPSVFDAIQVLYDRDPAQFLFVLCGSSARKLRESGANLLPGRSLLHHLYPLVLCERPGPGGFQPRLSGMPAVNLIDQPNPKDDLLERLSFGDLPGVLSAPDEVRESLLRSYATIYLEEEIRREGYVVSGRKVSIFGNSRKFQN